jgi:hypothetical protein
VADPKSPQGFRMVLDPKMGDGLHALDLKTCKIVWSAKPKYSCPEDSTACSPAQSSAVTAIPGVVLSALWVATSAPIRRPPAKYCGTLTPRANLRR